MQAQLYRNTSPPGAPVGNPTSRFWVYTVFNCGPENPAGENIPGLVQDEQEDNTDTSATARIRRWFDKFQPFITSGKIKYVIGQLERCAQSGRLHVQLYVEYRDAVRRGELPRLLGLPRGYGWADARRGTREQAIAYCSKEETRVCGPFEHGRVELHPGHRSDLDQAVAALQAGGLKRVAEECPREYIKYARGFEALDDRLKPRDSSIIDGKEVHVLYGEPGTGKTTWARDNWPGLFVMPCPSQSQYWSDGYEGQETILFDDYGNSLHDILPWSMLLQVCDKWGVAYPRKHGYNWLAAKRVVFTSNHPPEQWHPSQKFHALERRITHLYQWTAFKSFHILKSPILPITLEASEEFSPDFESLATIVDELISDEQLPPMP